jgi:hypothetical protein
MLVLKCYHTFKQLKTNKIKTKTPQNISLEEFL